MNSENRDYKFENFLERLQLFQVCQNMLKITLGWRRDFYAEQLRKNINNNQENDRNLADECSVESLSNHNSKIGSHGTQTSGAASGFFRPRLGFFSRLIPIVKLAVPKWL